MIFRGGLVANDNDGIPLLINNKGEGYRVNGTAVSLWKMCNGTTFQQVLDEVIRISNHDESKVKSLLEMLSQQKKTSIIQLEKVKESSALFC